jgi:hypothetical protein
MLTTTKCRPTASATLHTLQHPSKQAACRQWCNAVGLRNQVMVWGKVESKARGGCAAKLQRFQNRVNSFRRELTARTTQMSKTLPLFSL